MKRSALKSRRPSNASSRWERSSGSTWTRRRANSRMPGWPFIPRRAGCRKPGPSFTLPIFNQNEGPIAEAEARRSEVAARFYQVQAAAIGEIEAASERYQTALAEIGEAEKTLGTIDRREKATRRAIELKDLDK